MSAPALSIGILLFTLMLFVSERVRHDLVALLALFACLAVGLVAPRQALLGFADPAVVAVAAVLVVGRAIELTGIASAIARTLIPANAAFPVRLAMLMVAGAGLSAFMNNIAALVITMPLAADIARRAGLPPGAALMPLSFATILGGMTTLIGTPANLLLSSVRDQELGAPLGFFAMTPVGLAVTIAGLAYLAAMGWRLIPRRPGESRIMRPWRVFELTLPNGEMQLDALRSGLRRASARLLAVFRDGVRADLANEVRHDDRLLVLSRCSPWEVAERAGLSSSSPSSGATNSVAARVVVAHGSLLIGEGYEAIRTRSGGRVSVIAGGPRPARLREPLDAIRIVAGDQLHIIGPEQDIAELVARARLLEVDRLDPAPLDRPRGILTLLIFAAAIAAAILGFAPPAVTFLAAAAAIAIVRIIPADEVYRSVDWSIIVLLAAMIPVGQAFEASGAAGLVAAALADLLAGSPAFWSLAALCGATLLLSIFLNNVATAVIMGPLAIDLAGHIGLDPDAALLAVLVGASSDFLTPIGHQNNLLVMGPGGYRFTDYARVGAPLALSTVLVAAALLAYGAG